MVKEKFASPHDNGHLTHTCTFNQYDRNKAYSMFAAEIVSIARSSS